jgi:hypothetical protein
VQSVDLAISVLKDTTVEILFLYKEYTDVHRVYGFCNRYITAVVEELATISSTTNPKMTLAHSRAPRPPTDVLFLSIKHHDEHQAQQNVGQEEKFRHGTEKSTHVSPQRTSTHLTAPSTENVTHRRVYPYRFQCIQYLEPADTGSHPAEIPTSH